MPIIDLKITEAELAGMGVISMADIPTGSPAEKKAKFDELSRQKIIPRINELIEWLRTPEAAKDLGVEPPEGASFEKNMQAYMDAIYAALQKAESVTPVYDALPESGMPLTAGVHYVPSAAVETYEFSFPAEGEVWVRFTVGEVFALTFAEGTRFIGAAPAFAAGGTYELHAKDAVVAAGKVVAA